MAVIAIPLLVWGGMPLTEAIAISSASTLVQALTGMIKLRRAIPWADVKPAIVVRLLALPVGILVLFWLDGIEVAKIKAFLGICIILVVLTQWFLKVQPKERLPAAWNHFAFFCSGLAAGMVGMGGPPLVVWLSAHRWNSDKIRAFLFANFAILSPINVLLIWVTFGARITQALGTGLLCAPVVILGSLAGVRLGSLIPRDRFRMLLFAVLLVLGIASVLSGLISPD